MQGKRVPAQIREQAEAYYSSGFNCAESVCKAVLDAFLGKNVEMLSAASTFFGGGIASTHHEACGAVTGGIVAMGYLFGRTEAGEDISAAKDWATEFRSQFAVRFKTTHCGSLIDGLDEEKRRSKCQNMTGEAAEILAKLINEALV